jgi:uncharacterized membrane protein YfcA
MTLQNVLLIFVALLCAAASGMGIGNAGLFVLYLTAVCGIDQLEAQGINLVFFLVGTATALVFHVKKRNIPWRAVGFLAIMSAIGAAVGALVANSLPTETLKQIFGAMLVISGAMTLFGQKKPSRKSDGDLTNK